MSSFSTCIFSASTSTAATGPNANSTSAPTDLNNTNSTGTSTDLNSTHSMGTSNDMNGTNSTGMTNTPGTSNSMSTDVNMNGSTVNANDNLTSSFNTQISNDAQLKQFSIDAVNNNGSVTLNGKVDSQAEADRAIAIAKSLNGVTSVQSNIIVKNK